MKRIMTKLVHKGPMPPKKPPQKMPAERLPLQEKVMKLTPKVWVPLEKPSLPLGQLPKRHWPVPKRKR